MIHSRNTSPYLLIVSLVIVCLLLIIMTSSTHAGQVYTWIDEKGITHISDIPPDNAANKIKKRSYKAKQLQNQQRSSYTGHFHKRTDEKGNAYITDRPPDNPVNAIKKRSYKTEQHQNQQGSSPTAGLNRENPIPLGVSALMSDGFEMTVVSFDGDAWPKVRAENQFNKPPASDKRMLMIRIRIKNANASKEPAVWLSNKIALVGSNNGTWETFYSESSCGVIPDKFYLAELYRGGKKEGNICFRIPKDETNLLLRYEENLSLSKTEYKYYVAGR